MLKINLKTPQTEIVAVTKKRWFKLTLISLAIFVCLFGLLIGGALAYQKIYSDKIYPGVYVGNFHLGGLTEKQAKEFVENFNNRLAKEGLDFYFTDEKGARKPIVMGCYGIGVSRALAAIIETNHDADGIIWPSGITPFDVAILPLNITHTESKKVAFDIYRQLSTSGVNVLLDDRDERSGVKFKDADLIGIPVRIIIGTKTLSQNTVELQKRHDKSICAIPIEGVAHAILKFLRE